MAQTRARRGVRMCVCVAVGIVRTSMMMGTTSGTRVLWSLQAHLCCGLQFMVLECDMGFLRIGGGEVVVVVVVVCVCGVCVCGGGGG